MAPALIVSRPAQRSLALRPACSPSHLSDPLHQRLRRFRFLHRRSDCFRVERTQFPGSAPMVVFSARLVAGDRGATEIGNEHLLEGIIREDAPTRLLTAYSVEIEG